MEKKVDQLKIEIQEAEKQLNDIQNSCSHKKQKLKLTKKSEVRWTCEKCDKIIRFATPQEVFKFLS